MQCLTERTWPGSAASRPGGPVSEPMQCHLIVAIVTFCIPAFVGKPCWDSPFALACGASANHSGHKAWTTLRFTCHFWPQPEEVFGMKAQYPALDWLIPCQYLLQVECIAPTDCSQITKRGDQGCVTCTNDKCVPQNNNGNCLKNGGPGLCANGLCVPVSGEMKTTYLLRLVWVFAP